MPEEAPRDTARTLRIRIADFGHETRRLANRSGHDGAVFLSIMNATLNDIATRALEIGDPVIIRHLEELGLVRDGGPLPAPTNLL